MNVELNHQEGFHSVITNDRGHRISIDTTSSDDPKGASPMELLEKGSPNSIISTPASWSCSRTVTVSSSLGNPAVK